MVGQQTRKVRKLTSPCTFGASAKLPPGTQFFLGTSMEKVNCGKKAHLLRVGGVGRFVDKTFRRRISGRFVDSIINVIPPLRDSSSYYSFHLLGLKYFQFVFRLVTRHLAAYNIVRACWSGSVTWLSRPREHGAGGVKLWAALARSDPGPSLWRCCSVIPLC